MAGYRFTLEKGSKKYPCPGCGKKSLKRYIDTRTGEYLPPEYGHCDHEQHCTYQLNPYHDGYTKMIWEKERGEHARAWKPYKPIPRPKLIPEPISFIPDDLFKASLTGYHANNFVAYIRRLFGMEVTRELLSKYPIGTSKHWSGATVFWQIDFSGRIRTGKIMLYNPSTGKRIKEPFDHITWVHSVTRQPEFALKQCFYGEHLLQDKTMPVAIVESEKTAVIASIYLPEFIWLASGSLDGLNPEKCQVLKGRNVTLYADLKKGFEKWSNKAKELSRLLPGTQFQVSDYLESVATEAEKQAGLDLADYLTRFEPREFLRPEPVPILPPTLTEQASIGEKPTKTNEKIKHADQPGTPRVGNWNREITELETFFTGITLPTEPIQLNQSSTITDIPLFLESHFEIVKAQCGNRTFLPYLERLQELIQYLSKTGQNQSRAGKEYQIISVLKTM